MRYLRKFNESITNQNYDQTMNVNPLDLMVRGSIIPEKQIEIRII